LGQDWNSVALERTQQDVKRLLNLATETIVEVLKGRTAFKPFAVVLRRDGTVGRHGLLTDATGRAAIEAILGFLQSMASSLEAYLVVYNIDPIALPVAHLLGEHRQPISFEVTTLWAVAPDGAVRRGGVMMKPGVRRLDFS